MADAFAVGEDHLPPLVVYIEQCLNTGAQWTLNAAEEAVRSTVDNANRSKVKILAGRWLQREQQIVDPQSIRAKNIERILEEMSKESNTRVLVSLVEDVLRLVDLYFQWIIGFLGFVVVSLWKGSSGHCVLRRNQTFSNNCALKQGQ